MFNVAATVQRVAFWNYFHRHKVGHLPLSDMASANDTASTSYGGIIGELAASNEVHTQSWMKEDGYTHSLPADYHSPVVPIDWVFYAVHIAAMVSLAVSIVCSSVVLILQARSHDRSFWQRKLGERLYIYQAWTDLVFSISHMCDHVIALTSLGDPNRILCTIFAFSLFETIMAQNMIVLLSALSLFLLVRFGYRLPFGPHDVGLLGTAYGGPAIFAIVFSILGYFGSSGYWCLTDNRNPDALTLHMILGLLQIGIVVIDIFLYSSVWSAIASSQQRLSNFKDNGTENNSARSPSTSTARQSDKAKYRRTAKVLTLFVVAFLIQWWPTIVIAIWTMVDYVKPPFYIVGVIFVNSGGLFNLFVFFNVRKTYHSGKGDSSTKLTKGITNSVSAE